MNSTSYLITAVVTAIFLCSFITYQPAPQKIMGSISGKITYDGSVPKARKVGATDDCGSVFADDIVVNRDKGLANVLVRLTTGVPKKTYRPSGPGPLIEIKNCVYVPHVVGVMVGQSLRFKNSDGILYNVHGLPKLNKGFNIGMPPTVVKKSSPMTKAEGPFQVKCDVHPWMSTYVAVMTHPYFAVSGRDGTFRIDNVPDGTYGVEAWHKKLGRRTGTANVKGGMVMINVKY